MEYKLVDSRWENKESTDRSSIEYIDNNGMDAFELLVNEAIGKGWKPNGAPLFMYKKYYGTHITTAIQSMVRLPEDIPQEDIPQETATRKSSRKIKTKK